jgi:hypothetical protein
MKTLCVGFLILDSKTFTRTYQSLPEVHESLPEVHKSLPEVHKSLPEVHESLPEVHESLPEVHKRLPEVYKSLPEIHESVPDARQRSLDVWAGTKRLGVGILNCINQVIAIGYICNSKDTLYCIVHICT